MGKIRSSLPGFAQVRWLAVVILAIVVAGFVTATTALMKGLPGKTDARKLVSKETFRTPSTAIEGSQKGDGGVTVGSSYHNDTSKPLRDMKPVPIKLREREEEENENPKIPHQHLDQPDGALQDQFATLRSLLVPNMPATTQN